MLDMTGEGQPLTDSQFDVLCIDSHCDLADGGSSEGSLDFGDKEPSKDEIDSDANEVRT